MPASPDVPQGGESQPWWAKEMGDRLAAWLEANAPITPSVSDWRLSVSGQIRGLLSGYGRASPLWPGHVFFERVGVLQAGEFNGKSTLNATHDAALNLSEHHENSHLGLSIAGDGSPRER
jgi:hypothetical protein